MITVTTKIVSGHRGGIIVRSSRRCTIRCDCVADLGAVKALLDGVTVGGVRIIGADPPPEKRIPPGRDG